MFSNYRNKLKVLIKNDRIEQFMKIKNILNHNERNFFYIEILLAVSTKYIITFFNKIINDNVNNVVFLH